MKIGVSVRIDVTKIDKARLYKGEKGTYLDLTTFVDTEEKDQYDNNGFISQNVSKEERESGVKGPILGNVKVFYSDVGGSKMERTTQRPQPVAQQAGPDYGSGNDFDDSDIPFRQHLRGTIV